MTCSSATCACARLARQQPPIWCLNPPTSMPLEPQPLRINQVASASSVRSPHTHMHSCLLGLTPWVLVGRQRSPQLRLHRYSFHVVAKQYCFDCFFGKGL